MNDQSDKFIKAARDGNIDYINDFYDIPSYDNNKALRVAAENGHTEIVRKLLEDPSVDPNDGSWEDDEGGDEESYYYGETDMLDKGDINALQFAAKNGHLDVVNILLEDTRVNPNDNRNLAIRLALRSENPNRLDIVNKILDDPRTDPSYLNHDIVYNVEEHEILNRLLQDTRIDKNRLFIAASINNNIELVKKLIQDPNVDPSAYDNEAIRLASYNGCIDVVNILLEDNRVDPSAENNYAIRYASQAGRIEVVMRLLKDPRVDPNSSLGSLYEYEDNHVGVVNILLKDPRVDPSAENNYAIKSVLRMGIVGRLDRLLQDDSYINRIKIIDSLLLDPRFRFEGLSADMEKDLRSRKEYLDEQEQYKKQIKNKLYNDLVVSGYPGPAAEKIADFKYFGHRRHRRHRRRSKKKNIRKIRSKRKKSVRQV